MRIDAVLDQVATTGAHYVTVTGGEPLAQQACLELLAILCEQGYAVSLETSGAIDISGVDSRVCRVIDLKTPGSGEVERNRLENIRCLTETDQIKFVICDRQDYDWAKDMLLELELNERCEVLFAPSYEQQPADELAAWILEDRLPVRLQMQIHKMLWGDARGR